MSVVVQSCPFETPRSNKVRRDSKDSCFSEEMSEDLSSTHIEDSYRLSPYATLSPISRKSSGGDSGISIADTDDGISEGELSRVSIDTLNFKRLKLNSHRQINTC